jgi:hypothetical protein
MTAPGGADILTMVRPVVIILVSDPPVSLIRVGALTLRGSGLLLLASVVGWDAPL